MLDQPTANLTIEEKDQAKIDLATNRLKVVQADVLEATREVARLESQAKKIQDANDYNNARVAYLEDSIADKVKENTALENTITLNRAENERLIEDNRNLNESMATKEREMARRKEAVEIREKDITDREVLVIEREQKVSKEKAVVAKALEAFADAAATVTWK